MKNTVKRIGEKNATLRTIALLMVTCLMLVAQQAIVLAEGQTQTLRPGDLVTFGHYEQDNDPGNGQESITWIVLASEKNRALLISEKNLDNKPYHTKDEAVTWETCSLRSWLNNEFLQAAFTPDEQQAILTTKVENKGNDGGSISGDNDTIDKVYLLSIAEAERYFTNNPDRIALNTAYVTAQGAYTDETGYGWWYLRTPSSISWFNVANVMMDGSINADGAYVIGGSMQGKSLLGTVRSVLYVDLNSGIF